MRKVATIAAATILLFVLVPSAFAKPGHGDVVKEPTVGAPPSNISAGTPWNARITFEGVERMDNPYFKTYLRITNTASGVRKLFASRLIEGATYEAAVVFPSAGSWRMEVVTAGMSWPAGSASVGPAALPPAGTGFPVAATAGGAAAVLAVLALAVVPRIRRSKPSPALG